MGKELSERYQRFAESKAKGENHEDAIEYAGFKARGASARVQASKLLTNANIKAEIKRLREESRSSNVKSAQQVKEDLSSLMDSAKGEKDYTGFVSLAGRLAKMDGHDEPERHQLEFEVNIGGDQDSQA